LCGAVDEYAAEVAGVYEPLWSEQKPEDDRKAAQTEPVLVER
jgi:hypothetical protein